MLHYIMLATAHSTALLGRGSALVLQSTYSNVILLHCTSMIDILKITRKFEISIEITHKIKVILILTKFGILSSTWFQVVPFGR